MSLRTYSLNSLPGKRTELNCTSGGDCRAADEPGYLAGNSAMELVDVKIALVGLSTRVVY